MAIYIYMKTFTFETLPVTLEEREINTTIPHQELAHWHDTLELIQVKQGQMHCHVNESDFLLKKGDICIINQDQVHRIYSDDTSCLVHTLSVDPMMLSSIHELYHQLILPIISDQDFTHIRMHGRNSHAHLISNLMDDLQILAQEKPSGYALQALAYVSMILRQVYIVHNDEPLEADHDEDLRIQKKMATFIYEHYGEAIGLSEIAQAGGISRSKCSTVFKKYTETSPIDFLNAYRLEKAAALLKNTHASIADIAFSCGFNQQSYFNRLFLREYGITPKAYRNA